MLGSFFSSGPQSSKKGSANNGQMTSLEAVLLMTLASGLIFGWNFWRRKNDKKHLVELTTQVGLCCWLLGSICGSYICAVEGGVVESKQTVAFLLAVFIFGLSLAWVSAVCLTLPPFCKRDIFAAKRTRFLLFPLVVCTADFSLQYFSTITKPTAIFGTFLYIQFILFCFVSLFRWMPIFANGENTRITLESLRSTTKPKLDAAFSSATQVPVGYSIETGLPAFITAKERLEHLIVVGSTGSGKSTLMKLQLAHAIQHGLPSIVIDQKGDGSLVRVLREYANDLGKDGSNVIQFSLSPSVVSSKFNPLKHGTAIEVKDRIMGSMEWTEEFYRNVAAQALSCVLPSFYPLGKIPTLESIERLLAKPEHRHQISKELQELLNSPSCWGTYSETYLSKCIEGLERISKFKGEHLTGLLAQLDILSNIENGHLLSPCVDEVQIDFVEVISKNQIVVFELPAANKDQSTRIGRLILGQLKSLMSLIESGRVPRPSILPVHVDEFGSYATTEFTDFMKQARSAGIAISIYFQSLGDCEQISDAFKKQLFDNAATKVFFRADDPDSVEYLSRMAGTVQSVQRSHQLNSSQFGFSERTGAGNERITKQMTVEHDVFKSLCTFEAVIIAKNPRRVGLMRTWVEFTK